jgi:hypothetical protein
MDRFTARVGGDGFGSVIILTETKDGDTLEMFADDGSDGDGTIVNLSDRGVRALRLALARYEKARKPARDVTLPARD